MIRRSAGTAPRYCGVCECTSIIIRLPALPVNCRAAIGIAFPDAENHTAHIVLDNVLTLLQEGLNPFAALQCRGSGDVIDATLARPELVGSPDA